MAAREPDEVDFDIDWQDTSSLDTSHLDDLDFVG